MTKTKKLKSNSSRRTHIAKIGYEISSKIVLLSLVSKRIKLTWDSMRAVVTIFIDYADINSVKIRCLHDLVVNIAVLESRTICCGCSVTIEIILMTQTLFGKVVLNGLARQPVFADKTFELIDAKRFSLVLVEEKEKCY